MADEAKSGVDSPAPQPSPANDTTAAALDAAESVVAKETKDGAGETPAKNPPVWNPTLLDEPVRLSGEVVHGFGRGSKMLGIPTANLPSEVIDGKLTDAHNGVYFGWACVNHAPVYKTVLSIGWNPFFKNKHRTVEPYLLHEFDKDFYGETLHLLICGFLREQADFASFDDLIEAIRKDVELGRELLDKEPYAKFARDELFPAAPAAPAADGGGASDETSAPTEHSGLYGTQ